MKGSYRENKGFVLAPIDVPALELEFGEFLWIQIAVVHGMWMFADERSDVNRLLYTVVEGEQNTEVAQIFCVDDFKILFHIFSRIHFISCPLIVKDHHDGIGHVFF